jgi:unsaturated rhamnogalacturonyl hydrolase
MNLTKPLFMALLAFFTAGNLVAPSFAQPELTTDSIMKVTKRVAAYRTGYARDWIYATCCTGVMALYQTSGEKTYLTKMVNWGAAGNWLPADGNRASTNADNQCCCQTYCETYLAEPIAANANRYLTWKADWDSITTIMKPKGRVLWSWEDALFMAPPAVAMLGTITGDIHYFDTLSAYWWDVAGMLYDTTYHLYYRDASKINGRYNNLPVFWGRGMGWVAAGYSRVLKYMPKNYAGRPKHEQQFKDICSALLKCQGSDGLWRSNLLSPSQYPDPEMSGSAFYCYAFAWGVNNGILERATYEPAAKKAWSGMLKYVNADGSIANVQPVGGAPGAPSGGTQPYAEGGVMLAGTELFKLAGGTGTVPASHLTNTTTRRQTDKLFFDGGRSFHGALPTNATGFELYDMTGKKLCKGLDQSAFRSKSGQGGKIVVVRYIAK